MADPVVYKTTFQFKRGQAATWTSLNPILAAGEPGFELDTGRLKIGDGITQWNLLHYYGGSAEVSVDGKSLIIHTDGTAALYGFDEAIAGQIPSKNSDGTISWVEPEVGEPIPDSDIHNIIDK